MVNKVELKSYLCNVFTNTSFTDMAIRCFLPLHAKLQVSGLSLNKNDVLSNFEFE